MLYKLLAILRLSIEGKGRLGTTIKRGQVDILDDQAKEQDLSLSALLLEGQKAIKEDQEGAT